MNENKATIFLILIIALGITGFNSFFIVTEGKQAIVTHFGDPVGEPVTTSGVHFKVPFIHDVRYVDKRILSWDGFPNQIPTKDKKSNALLGIHRYLKSKYAIIKILEIKKQLIKIAKFWFRKIVEYGFKDTNVTHKNEFKSSIKG